MAKKREPTRADWEVELNIRCWKDPEFKKLLLTNPQEALKQLGVKSGLEPPKVQIVEEKNGAQIVVIHEQPRRLEGLSEEELKDLHAAGYTGNECNNYISCLSTA